MLLFALVSANTDCHVATVTITATATPTKHAVGYGQNGDASGIIAAPIPTSIVSSHISSSILSVTTPVGNPAIGGGTQSLTPVASSTVKAILQGDSSTGSSPSNPAIPPAAEQGYNGNSGTGNPLSSPSIAGYGSEPKSSATIGSEIVANNAIVPGALSALLSLLVL